MNLFCLFYKHSSAGL